MEVNREIEGRVREKDADIVRNIVLAWLAEKSFISSIAKRREKESMKTVHKIYFKNAVNMREVSDETINLVVTSPPYPMIEMWDELFSS